MKRKVGMGPVVRIARNCSWDPWVVLGEARRPGSPEACRGERGSAPRLQAIVTWGRGMASQRPAWALAPAPGSGFKEL